MSDWVHLAIVCVVLVPLFASPLAVIVGYRTFAFAIAWIASGLSLLCALILLMAVKDGTVLSYAMGGWAPPIGIEYRVDAANALVLVIVSAMAFITLPYSRETIRQEIATRHHTLFYACLMLCLTGLLGVTITGDAFNVFVFLEISSLATYVLVSLGAKNDKRALSAAYDYLILGTIGATFFVIGLGMIYQATGTLNMVDLAEKLSGMEENRTVRSAFAFLVIGMGLKVAIYPLHRWLPGAYAFAPSSISAFLAATSTKVAIYVLMRFMFSVYSVKFVFELDLLEYIVMPLAVLGMFVGSAVAVYQANIKRLLAFSSIAQIGYMLLGIGLVSVEGTTATMAHLFNHAVTKGALFLAVGAIIYRIGSPLVRDMEGIGRQMPWTGAAMVIGGLSLIGVPATAGFVSKWQLLFAAFEKGWWPISMLIVASSLIAVIYVWRIVETLYMKPVPAGRDVSEAPLSLLIPTWVLIIATIYFGIDANAILSISEVAARSMLEGGYLGDATIVGEVGR
ncbi:monovalent cation/H+ antiporter subunit D family protein [Ahrensia sp. R2A130]|uniref:monovalent cation/H+ antiporter subunit D family protein n=1 Tax=Ahrensia sp. R2A130 TaxID=744979 RepID=UPI0001E0E0CC|nr:monovalent cation/H+ antiporter subunit D family protein [Ahrensia sp. R2A130]EFL88932.1 NADH dehydrogenase [Ahrensia sp. R2A130]